MAVKVSVISPPKDRISIKGTEQKIVRVSSGGFVQQTGVVEEPFPTGDYGYFADTDYDAFGVFQGRIYDCNDPTVLKIVDFGVLET